MKKRRFCSALLALTLLLNLIFVPVAAEQATDSTDESETTTPTETIPDENATVADVEDTPFGSVCQIYGCRTIDGEVPLAGSERMLDTAQAAFVYERNTKTVVYAYNPDLELRPGALAKIVTALIVIERCNLDDIVTVSSANISKLPAGSINKNLKQDEQLTVEDLLYCLILEQANDAAIALAEHVAGTMTAFVELMNRRVQEIGCGNTEFANVHGLDNADQHTTARDMAKIVLTATENPTFCEIFGAVSYTVPATNRTDETRSLKTTNYLIDNSILQNYMDSRVTGGMQTYTSSASGAGLVCTATDDDSGMDFVMVVMGCTRTFDEDNSSKVSSYGSFDEMEVLLEKMFSNYKLRRVLYDGQAIEQFSVIDGNGDVVGQVKEDISSVLPINAYMENLIFEYDLIDGPTAPIEAGEKIGTMQVWYRDSCLMETELFAMEAVKSATDEELTISGQESAAATSAWVTAIWVICLIIVVPVAGYLIINSYLRKRQRAMRRRRRAGRRRFR